MRPFALNLADSFPQTGLAPPPPDRGAYYRWLFFAAGPVESAVTNKALGFEVLPEGERTAGYGTLGHVLDALEGTLAASDYIAGPQFTAADVYVGAQVGWGMQFGTIAERPAFAAYWKRLTAPFRAVAERVRHLSSLPAPRPLSEETRRP